MNDDGIPDGANAPCWSPKIGRLFEHDPDAFSRGGEKGAARGKNGLADNEASRFELFILDDGQSKVEEKEETRMLTTPHLCARSQRLLTCA